MSETTVKTVSGLDEADTNGDGSAKSNFFESKVTAYNQSSAIDGWDF